MVFKARDEGYFKSLEDFCERVDRGALNKRVLESLIKAGAFDTVKKNCAVAEWRARAFAASSALTRLRSSSRTYMRPFGSWSRYRFSVMSTEIATT